MKTMSRDAPLVVFVLASACATTSPHSSSDPHETLGRLIEPRRELSMSGRPIAIPADAKATLVDFWSTTCAPCVRIMPQLEMMARELGPRGLVVIGVARDDNPGLVALRLRELDVTYPNIIDDSGQVAGAFRVGATLPQAFVIDRAGRVRYVSIGDRDESGDGLRKAVVSLLDGEAQ